MRPEERAGFVFSQCHGHSGDDVAMRRLELSRATALCDRYTLENSLIVTVTFLIVTRYKHSISSATATDFVCPQNNETSLVRYS